MKFVVGSTSTGIGCLILLWLLFSCSVSDASDPLTLIYSGEEQGQLGLHGCGAEQVGGLSRRQTVIQSLREKHSDILNLHTGNILSPTDPNVELIYQIALEALEEMNYDAFFLGPHDLCLPVNSLQALHAKPSGPSSSFAPTSSLQIHLYSLPTSFETRLVRLKLPSLD